MLLCTTKIDCSERERNRQTYEVVRRQCLKVPDLQNKNGRNFLLRFVQRENALSFFYNYNLWKNKKNKKSSQFCIHTYIIFKLKSSENDFLE